MFVALPRLVLFCELIVTLLGKNYNNQKIARDKQIITGK